VIDLAVVAYKPGWAISLSDRDHLHIEIPTLDSGDYRTRTIDHVFGVPAAAPSEGWTRWLYDRICDVERHEAGEFFTVGGRKPFYPAHGREGDPYEHRENP